MSKRKLQKLIDFAQMNLKNKADKTLSKLYNDLLDRFTVNQLQMDNTYSSGLELQVDHLNRWQEHLQPVIKMLREEDQTEYVVALNMMVVNGEVISYVFFEDQLLLDMYRLINGLKLSELKTCPECGNLFIEVGKKIRTYCSSRCVVDAHGSDKT